MVLNEDAVPSIYWAAERAPSQAPGIGPRLKQGAEIEGVALSDPEPVLSVRTR